MPKGDKPAASGVVGLVVVDKPPGLTSMQAVARIRRQAGGARTGHAGTLDPLATGVLVVALGRATKILQQLTGLDKRYVTRIDLSAFTETDDREGAREEIEVAAPPSEADVQHALTSFTGSFLQRPPAFSAVKVDGRRAYKTARRGGRPQLEPRPVIMHALELREYDWPFVELSLHCGKGLYVRSLARELGAALGTGGYCVSIHRTAVGPFRIEHATPLDDVPDPLTADHLIGVDDALAMVEAARTES